MKASRVAVFFCCSFALAVACVAAPAPLPKENGEPKLRATFKGHTAGVYSVAFSPDGDTLASGSKDPNGTVKLWDVKTGKVRSTLNGHPQGVLSVAFSPDGKTLASGGNDKTVKLWDVKTGKVRATLKGHTEPVLAVAFSSDGKALASGGNDKTVRLWDIPKSRR